MNTLFLLYAGNLTVDADKEKTTFIPDTKAAEIKIPKKPLKPLVQVLTPETTLGLFMLLPEKVFPLSMEERKKALADEKIESTTKDNLTTVKWQSAPFSDKATEMNCIGYSIDKEPIVEVVYKWTTPGMIVKSHSYTYHLTRKPNGWLIKRLN